MARAGPFVCARFASDLIWTIAVDPWPHLSPCRYEDRGILGQVVDAEISDNGVCEMKVSEALVNKVRPRRNRVGRRARGALPRVPPAGGESARLPPCPAPRLLRQVTVRTLDKNTGEPCKGKTRPEVITRALTIAPGSVYSLRQLKQDLDAIYSTGIFEDVNMVPSPSDEPGKARQRAG